ncbi:histidine phosphatase family protein [Hymenobacter sp. ASUV-10]|uniref:Histidine phosphatase family protein n=1 Tax=Hymenobacter aranciens TaxID=3063996 RepID=A0ABT9B5T0_9BACT|nr:histidine phosphatase family protein [Hymenobacter sp. ASUV-10]MDO7873575.1 histidine phosphatase family protein [Hymenobacter sp. ASUV-10]
MIDRFTESDRHKLFLLYHLNPVHPKAPPVPKGPLLQVVIIRHGEKPTEGDNLSAQGFGRALALPAVLNRVMPRPPQFTYVPCIGTDKDTTTRVRMMQTVLPYAVQHNLTINSDYAPDEVKGLAKELRRRRGTVLLVWEHHNIVRIAAALGIAEPQEWPDDDYDSIWTITFKKGRAKGKARQPVLTKGQQDIQPTAE